MAHQRISESPERAVLPQAATAAEGEDDRMGPTPLVPHSSATSNGAAIGNKRYSRREDGKYRGVFHNIMTNLRAGTTLFFSDKELTHMMCVMNAYKKHVIAYKKLVTLGKQFGRDMAAEILRLEYGSDIAVTHRDLLEKKAVMNEKISHLLAIKAEKMLKYSSSYKSQFGPSRKYYGLKPYFRLQTINDTNLYWSHYIVVSRMVRDFVVIHENRQRRWDLRRKEEEDFARDMREEEEQRERSRCYRAYRGFEYEDDNHEAELSQNGYRRAWYSGRRYGAGSDSDSD